MHLQNNLHFYTNTSLITKRKNKYTKYYNSRPDQVSYHGCLVASNDFSRLFYIGTGERSLVEAMKKGLTLNTEHKKNKDPPKDPIGQLLAGMEKTMGDIFYVTQNQESCLQYLTMFGFYLIPSEDSVEIYKANVEIGKPTTVYKGGTTLSVQDAFNRIMYQLLL